MDILICALIFLGICLSIFLRFYIGNKLGCGCGSGIKGLVIGIIGLTLFYLCIYCVMRMENIMTDKNKGTWDNQEVFFWEDVDKNKIIEEWQECQCSKCGKWLTTPYAYSFTEYEYCPHCGSPMKTGGNDENK